MGTILNTAIYLTIINRKGPMPQNIKVQFIKLLQMQKYNIADFFGEFERNSDSPNTFHSQAIDTSVILRCRPQPQPTQTPNYLVYRKGKGKAHYMSALWSFNSTTKGAFEYIITDTQGAKAIVEIDMFILRIKKP